MSFSCKWFQPEIDEKNTSYSESTIIKDEIGIQPASEENSIKEDSLFYNSLSIRLRKNPLEIEQLLKPDQKYIEDLGFGYHFFEGSIGIGCTSIFYQLVYYKTALIGYRLEIIMPKDKILANRYSSFCQSLFPVDKDGTVHPLYCNYEEMIKPLDGYSNTISANEDVSFFMTPFSGIIYGNRGGFGNTYLENRIAYLKIRKMISPKICEQLLYSKNPATRLTAAEYYYSHKHSFRDNKQRVENRILEVFKEMPQVLTMSGCLIVVDSPKVLVEQFANINHK